MTDSEGVKSCIQGTGTTGETFISGNSVHGSAEVRRLHILAISFLLRGQRKNTAMASPLHFVVWGSFQSGVLGIVVIVSDSED